MIQKPSVRKLLALLFTIVAVAALTSILFFFAQPNVAEKKEVAAPPEIPPLTPEVKAMLEKSRGFEVLVSYTDNGFEPATTSIKKGETIRFTNNSSGTLLWVAARGGSGAVYPGSGTDCGQSAFDTCNSIGRGEFWEFTFDIAGMWGYRNNRDTSKTGVVEVK